ncbi:MAG TPA: response regulator [Magnetovibrio sp.]
MSEPTASTSDFARILIAADSPLEALTIENMLRGAGHRDIRVTSDAREIVAMHEKWPFKVLVLDMGIRSLGSLDVLNRLSDQINHRQLAVLALTQAGDEIMQERALGAGAMDVFARPFTRSETLIRVAGALASLPGPTTDEAIMRAVRRRFAAVL